VAEFPEPMEGSVFYEDEVTYACLAFHPIRDGHTIIVWKADVEDLNDLSEENHAHLMNVMYKVRKALLIAYGVPKVYVAYLDEALHVHIHLFPRKEGEEMGFGLMARPHGELTDLSMVSILRSFLPVS